MTDFTNIVRREVERQLAGRYNRRSGLVTSWDKKTHSAKVMIKPDDVETGWIPVHAHHVGNGWGVVVGLTPGDGKKTGDQVELDFSEGDFDQPRITTRVHSDEDKPPEVESGEMMFQHKEAGSIKFDKDKNLTITGAKGQVIKKDKDGNISISIPKNDASGNSNDSATMKLSFGDDDHTVTITKDGIKHKSNKKVTIEASKIEHNGSLKVSGSILAGGVVQSGGFNGAPSTTPADTW